MNAFDKRVEAGAPAVPEGSITVNLMRYAGLDKHDGLAAYRAQQEVRSAHESQAEPAPAPSEQQAQGELPPLPIEWRKVEDGDGIQVPVFRAFQMWDYARAALAQRPALVSEKPLQCKANSLVPLTDSEVDELSRTMVKSGKSVNWLCRAIERAHGITAPVNAVNSPKAKDKQP